MKFSGIFFLTALTLLFTESYSQQNSDSIAKRHQDMMAIMLTTPKYPVKNIGIYVYDGVNTLDAFGPYHVLAELMNVNIFFIAKQKGFIQNQRGLKIEAAKSIDEVKQLDILVIPGGAKETFMQTQDTTLLNWIRMIDKNTYYTTSVCTGSWILGATGLLKDKNVSSNWYRAEEIMKMYGAHFKPERYVQDGKYWTSAGVTAGMDMALGILKDLMGDQYTQGAMLDLEYDPKPPINAGAVGKTDGLVVDMMQSMYDMGLLSLIEAEKAKRTPKKKPTLWQQWPALDEYHKVMAMTFHPAETGDLVPLKKYGADLATTATDLKKSVIPEELNKPGLPDIISLLEKESLAMAKMIKSKKSDAVLKKSIFALHDRFHQIVEKCVHE